MSMNSYFPIPIEAFLRLTRDRISDSIILMLATFPKSMLGDNRLTLDRGVFIKGNIILNISEAYKPGNEINGMRADQILCQLWDTKKMKNIKLS